MLVDAAQELVEVPRAFVENGRIILNISPEATHSLVLGNDAVGFNARFSGTAMDVHVPVPSVLAIYARENGQGMMFGDQDDTPPEPGPCRARKAQQAVSRQIAASRVAGLPTRLPCLQNVQAPTVARPKGARLRYARDSGQ